MVGSFDNATMFRFHATKLVNAIEGGAVVTDSDEIAARLWVTIDFGFTGIERVEFIGMNAKMS